tara:strand:+ start:26591 stop:27766 length:1176 start_codon:yes stop_codon:yes gene_type:complete
MINRGDNLSIKTKTLLSALLFLTLSACAQNIESTEETIETCSQESQYVFGWQFIAERCDFLPRGGTSRGSKTYADHTPSKHWQALQSSDIHKHEKDRQAILSMSGYYRVSFDFIETMGFTQGYAPSRPYRSWGTEFVEVIENENNFISLQHIMVMYFTDNEGNVSEPMVMKHWRQDWHYEKPTEFIYMGNSLWQQHDLNKNDIAGTWAQSVFQVDDSPRYESHGQWHHNGNRSEWISKVTWRPLPRREGSVRNDYQVLEGVNKHIILPNGWVQEEENFKLVVDENGKPDAKTPYLAKELGIARYERIKDHDFSPGEQYWQKAAPYWQDVRAVWHELVDEHSAIEINKTVDGKFMFMPFFERAQQIVDGSDYDSAQERKNIKSALAPFISAQ